MSKKNKNKYKHNPFASAGGVPTSPNSMPLPRPGFAGFGGLTSGSSSPKPLQTEAGVNSDGPPAPVDDGLATAPVAALVSVVKELAEEHLPVSGDADNKMGAAPEGIEPPSANGTADRETACDGPAQEPNITPPVASEREQLVEAIRTTRQLLSSMRSTQGTLKVAVADAERARDEAGAAKRLCDAREAALKQREDDLIGRASEIEKRHLALLGLEASAREGFPEQLREAREHLRRQLDIESSEVRTRAESLDLQEKEIRAQRLEVQRERSELARARADLDLRVELQSDRDRLTEDQAAKRVQSQLDALRVQVERAESRVKEASQRADMHKARVAELESMLDAAGGKSIADLVTERDLLRKKVSELGRELMVRPGQETLEQYKASLARLELVEGENQQLRGERAGLRAELQQLRIAADAIGSHEDQRKSLEATNRRYKEMNADLRAELDAQLTQAAGKNPFRELSRMDGDVALQTAPSGLRPVADLKRVVSELRQRMALQTPALYYSERTIRCFLAGLSMSRLQLLQGISGTGKTSLPRAVAAALGGRSDITAVQAGWRDRQDLLGYYNEFDKKYHETEFVKALYRAQCPQWSDRVCIIVLDEMNLSYVEQFGADLLSELESPRDGGPRLPLLHFKHTQAPGLLVDGMDVRLPANVWFVGTANHDETTKDFADKTYDRANAMELPRSPDRFIAKPESVPPPASCTSLLASFEKARKDHRMAADQARRFIGSLEGDLKGKLGIGWGNRLERQINDFVPVVVAAGGSVAEAVDQLVCSKLLRKLRNRHDVRSSSLGELRRALESGWKELDSNPPELCQELLNDLSRSRSFEDGD